MRAETVFVTGGTGFIGSRLVKKLLDSGARVHVLSRTPRRAWRLDGLRGRLELHAGDLSGGTRLSPLLGRIRPGRIFHLAAKVSAERDPSLIDEMLEVNLRGTARLAAACPPGLTSFLYAGTCEEYGDGPVPFREEQRERPVSPYSASKAMATQFLLMLHRSRGFPAVVARPFLTYGPGQDNGMFVPSLIRACLEGRDFKMTSGKQTREFNFVDDVAEGLLAAASARAALGEIVNIGNGREIAIKDAARLIRDLTGAAIRLKLGALAERPGETPHFFASTAKARRILGWKPRTTLKSGLRATIDWFRGRLRSSA